MSATHPQRILRLLQERGSRGITLSDFAYRAAVDEGSPIYPAKFASALRKLRTQGHTITRLDLKQRETAQGKQPVYILEEASMTDVWCVLLRFCGRCLMVHDPDLDRALWSCPCSPGQPHAMFVMRAKSFDAAKARERERERERAVAA